jgi:two-component system, chemotaxis family, CheB/CheR fusion protein
LENCGSDDLSFHRLVNRTRLPIWPDYRLECVGSLVSGKFCSVPNMNRSSKAVEPRPPERFAHAGTTTEFIPQRKSMQTAEEPSFLIVAVGASAGGLEAFIELLKPLPRNPGMTFVLIPHLDPKHKSAMTELMSRATAMEVLQVRDGMRVNPNCVYVIPPNSTMTIQNGVLRLAERERESAPPMPIDTFFRSLAVDCRNNAIGIILSGTATDGTLGIAAIKNEGGITFAQDARSAKYPGMPNSAVAGGHIDFVLRPVDIAHELMRIRQHPYVNGSQKPKDEPALKEHQAEMSQVFRLLKQVRKVDFSDYKPATIRRRIHRRMALARVVNLEEYLDLLRSNPQEVEALHQDILINVTSFFRDPEAFEALKEVVYPAILKKRANTEPVRIWVPGCSTGEEAYSHAIALVEYVSKIRADIPMQIFGTDLSEEAIRVARAGIYKESIAADVTPSRLRRFFRKGETGYQISKSIRDMCVFATQNVFNDPPFSRMDLVSCRNVLIYLSPALQKRVIPVFHYALKTGGFLMVGNTEGIVGLGSELFEPADKRHKIYRRRSVASSAVFGTSPEDYEQDISTAARDVSAAKGPEPVKAPLELQREADRLLLTRYAPAAVVVNEQYDILQIRGRASRYLELPCGKATLNLMKMVKSGLLFELQKALEEARANASPVRKDNLQFETSGGFGSLTVEVIPFHAPLQPNQSFVIVFEEQPGDRVEPEPKAAEPGDAKDRQIAQLKQELAATKEYLQSIIEALEASNEELQSANEEIQSGNEELQSTNEELQTSKEELESANEELNTVNDEMQHRNSELTQLNNDLINLLVSVNIPILMLDGDLSIRRMTPQVEEVLGITPADLTRPIRHVRLKVDVPDLERNMLEVIESLQPREIAVRDGQNRQYRVRITPYRTIDNRIEGVVLVFLDLSALKRPGVFTVGATKVRKNNARRKEPRTRRAR